MGIGPVFFVIGITYVSRYSLSALRNIEGDGFNSRFRFIGSSAPRGYTKDEGRSLGVGLQEQAPKHLKLLW